MSAISLLDKNIEVIINPLHGGRIEQIYFQSLPLLYVPLKEDNSTGWINHGGDFLWLAPQSKWGSWPPLAEFDQLAWKVLRSDDAVVVRSEVWNGVQLERKIFFEAGALIVNNSIKNVSEDIKEWGLWNISQLKNQDLEMNFISNDLKIFDFPPDITVEQLLLEGSIEKRNDRYIIDPNKSDDFKVGAVASNNILTCNIGDVVMEKELVLPRNYDKTDFPHQCSIEVYKNDYYLEAELVWPMTALKPGDCYIGTQKFNIYRR